MENLDNFFKILRMQQKMADANREIDEVLDKILEIVENEEDEEKTFRMLEMLVNVINVNLVMYKSTLDTFLKMQKGEE